MPPGVLPARVVRQTAAILSTARTWPVLAAVPRVARIFGRRTLGWNIGSQFVAADPVVTDVASAAGVNVPPAATVETDAPDHSPSSSRSCNWARATARRASTTG